MSSPTKPVTKKEDEWAKAFEAEYKESHPDGPYQKVEIKPKPEAKPA